MTLPVRAGQWLLVAGLGLLAGAEANAFDCAKARSASEMAICANPALHANDEQLATLYRDLVSALPADEAQALRADQRAWIADRDKECPAKAKPSPAACLSGAYRRRLADLNWLAGCAGSQPGVDCAVRGNWIVAKVLTADSGVQAVDPNDPALRKLTLQERQGQLRLADEVCGAPSFRPQLQAASRWFTEAFDSAPSSFGWPGGAAQRLRQLRLGCSGDGTLGPQAVAPALFNVRADGQLGLRYYDGAFLLLRRQK